MKSKFITDPQDPSDSFGFLDTTGAEVYTNLSFPAASFSLSTTQDVGGPPSSNPVEIPSTPALTSEAAEASGAQSGPTSPVSLTSGGITINLLFDAAAMAAPASFRAGIQQAAALLTTAISDKITVNIKIDYSGTGGGAAAGPDNGLYESYTSVRADLINNATPGDTTFNALPGGSSFQGQSNVAIWNTQLKLWGLLGANDTTTDDGSATFATDINSNLLVGVALHELTHAMGRVPYGPPYSAQPDIFDFFRFTSPGTRLISGSSTAGAAYFSVDGGNTKLADYGQTSDPADFLNSGVQGPNDPFNEFYNGSTIQSLSAADKEQLDVLGFHTTAPATPTVIESFGSTSLTEIGTNFFFYTGGSGPELKYGGAAVVASQFGAWAAIGAEQTASGYDVAWKNSATGLYTVWATDSSGNDVSSPVGAVSGSDTTLQAIETAFHQDLNGDGVIGVNLPTTVMESFGSTSLTEIGTNFFFYTGGSGRELKYGGVAVVAGQFGAWAPIGAEQTASGYDVAWKNSATGLYTVWATDSSGNDVSSPVGAVSGSDTTLQAIEPAFHQDLNGDGVIGVNLPTTVMESFGSTSLTEIGTNFFFYTGGSGPELKYGGVAVIAGQFGAWAPIGAEQTASGYDVAWKNSATGLYTVWATDSSGNDVSSPVGAVSGSDTTLQAIETAFHQDLNGDGVIGVNLPTTVMESFGSTSLTEIGTNFFFYTGGSGPELKYGGVAVVAGQFGAWAPIGAEQTASGYDVAWKNSATGLYTVWATDSSGNDVSSPVGAVSGSDTTLQAIETAFHQDLNGDGVIGVPPSHAGATLELAGASSDSITFTGSRSLLILETPSTFSGQITGFTGDGTLAGSDKIDLRNMNSNTVHAGYNSSTGVLDLSDGTTTADLKFFGTYTQANFKFADDGNAGTIVHVQSTSGQQSPTASQAAASATGPSVTTGHDSFVFAPNFGQVAIANFTPATDTIQFRKSIFADMTALQRAIHDDPHGNAVITDSAHDTITVQHVTTAQLLAHQGDFHFV